MVRERWGNGNQVGYGSGGWYRYVIDREIGGDTISIWWGIETNLSLFDSVNNGDSNVNGQATPFSNLGISHSGANTTWFRGQAFNVPRGTTITASGYVDNLADGSGGGARSQVGSVSWTNPALPPNQMAAPTVTNLKATTHTVNWVGPGTNGTPITGYRIEWQNAANATVAAVDVGSTARSFNAAGFQPNTAYKVRIFAKSAAGNSVNSAFRTFTTAVAAPIAPGAPTVTRNSDTSHSLAWTRGSQTAGPYASQEVLRRVRSNGTWSAYSVLATVSASATSYVDTTTVANRNYQYEVRATNVSGTATSPDSAVAWTTPGPPTDQVAAKDAASNIVVSWGAPASAPDASNIKYEVSESTDGGTTWTVKTTTAAGALSWTHTGPNSTLTHTYRVRAIVSPTGLVGSGLASGYVTTNTVQLLTPPAAPTNLTQSPAGTANRAEPIVLSWTHNPLDSSPQTKYTLQHRLAGTTTWTTVGPTTSGVSSYTLPANTYATGAAFEWRALTYGLHADPGPYSSVATVQISSTPGVSISSPATGSVVTSTSTTVSWTFSDPDGDPQGSWEATLLGGDGAVLETRSGSDTASSTTFAYRLQETAYSIQVRVRDSRGLWSTPDVVSFTVAYPLPPTPIIAQSTWDWKTGTVELDLEVPEPSGSEVAPTYLEVWRSIDGGPLRLLVTNLPPATLSYLDFTPTVEGTNTYVIQAVSDLPSGSQSDPEDVNAVVVTPQPGDGRPAVWLSGGPDFTRVGRLASQVAVDTSRIRERVLQVYAGRPLPVEHSGEHVTEVWQISGNLNLRWSTDVDAPDSPEDWIALGSLAGPHLLRMPALFGEQPLYAYVSIEGPKVTREVGGNVMGVSFTATRTEA